MLVFSCDFKGRNVASLIIKIGMEANTFAKVLSQKFGQIINQETANVETTRTYIQFLWADQLKEVMV